MPFPDEVAPVVLVEYCKQWEKDYGVVADTLRGLELAEWGVIEHVGSTAIPGLVAKDVIDVQVRVPDLSVVSMIASFTGAGFRHRPEEWNNFELTRLGVVPKLVFAPPIGARRVNLHVRIDGSPGARDTLLFRDYLRSDDVARDSWGSFKRSIVDRVEQIDLASYGQAKQTAWYELMDHADGWAANGGWQPSSLVPWSRI